MSGVVTSMSVRDLQDDVPGQALEPRQVLSGLFLSSCP